MDVCPSCGETLELVEDAGLRSVTDDGVSLPGGEREVEKPKARMVCSVCSWPVDESRP